MDFLKAEQVGKNKWRVLSIPFGGPFDGKDFDGEFFSLRTDIKPNWFDRRPLIWHHNLDQMMKADSTIGTADDLELEDGLGWWTTVWLDRSHRYWSQVDQMLRGGKLYGSSGTLQNFAKTDHKTGEILVWPFMEQTFTPIPSNPYSVVVASKSADHFAEAGLHIDLDSLEADLLSDLPDGGDDAAIRGRLRARAEALAALTKTL